jgi:type IV pilus assembly protein PilE
VKPVANLGRNRGFTLIELMIVVVVVAILAAIAYPSYQNYILKSKRAEAHESLLRVALEQEKVRANHTTYITNVGPTVRDVNGTVTTWGLGLAASAATAFDTGEGLYRITITSADATGFVAEAQALGGQTRDKNCQKITIELDKGETSRGGDPGPGCW